MTKMTKTSTGHGRRAGFLCAVMIAGLPSCLEAQSSSEANAGLQFNFSSPGARSLGLGGAFVGIADDATAVFTNPAGLTNLLKAEVALEARGFSYTTTFTDRGRGFGPPTGIGIDDEPGLVNGESTHRVAALSFGSVVLPSDRWSIALYRHDLAHFRSSTRSQGALFDVITFGKPQPVRFLPATSALKLGIVSYGASAAFRINHRLSIGLTLDRRDMSLDSQTTRFTFAPEGIYIPADFRTPAELQIQHGRDSDWAIHSGLLWAINDRLVFGTSFQQGSDFRVAVKKHAPGQEVAPEYGVFHIPSIYRAGLAYNIGESSKLSVEVDRIRYSQLAEGFVRLYDEPAPYRADDGTEIHVGVQRILLNDFILDRIRYPLVLTLGAWRDPDHRVRYVDESDPQSLLFRKGKDEYHGSIGVALAMGEAHEIGVAYDYSRRQRTLSASVIARF